MGDDVSSPASPPRFVVVLVHGTWGRGFNPTEPFIDVARHLPGNMIPPPRWFDLGSAFRSRLEDALHESLDVAVEAFHWSGANSVFARNDAAMALAARLKSLRAEGEQVIIIAHSHGGNVALRALELFGPEAQKIRLITLATPFLRMRAAEAAQRDLLSVPSHRILYCVFILHFPIAPSAAP